MKKKLVLLVILMGLNACINTDNKDQVLRQNLYNNENISISQDETSLGEDILTIGLFILEAASLFVDDSDEPPIHCHKNNSEKEKEFYKYKKAR